MERHELASLTSSRVNSMINATSGLHTKVPHERDLRSKAETPGPISLRGSSEPPSRIIPDNLLTEFYKSSRNISPRGYVRPFVETQTSYQPHYPNEEEKTPGTATFNRDEKVTEHAYRPIEEENI